MRELINIQDEDDNLIYYGDLNEYFKEKLKFKFKFNSFELYKIFYDNYFDLSYNIISYVLRFELEIYL